MPDYNQNDNRGQAIPPKPRDKDEAARASEKAQQRENDAARQVSKDWDKRQDQRIADAKRQLEKTKEPPPSMRLYGRDRMINTDQGRNPERSQPIKEMSPAQREMMTKLKDARDADRQQTRSAYDDKQYVKLPEKPQPNKPEPQPNKPEAKKELTPAQQQMAEKMRAAREADREQARAKAPEKPPPDRSR